MTEWTYKRPKARRGKRTGKVQNLGALVRKVLTHHVNPDTVRLEEIRHQWDDLVTPRVALRTWPAYVRGAELVVDVQDNQWLHELTYLRQVLLDRLAETIPRSGVRSLRLRLGRVPPPHARRLAVPAEPPPPAPAPLSPDPPTETLEALHAVQDNELREAMAAARLMLGRPPKKRRP